jgi:hypothetical protein
VLPQGFGIGFFKESKVGSELVPIQEPASLVNKEGPHLPTGKYQIPVVTQKKNTKICSLRNFHAVVVFFHLL